jgi:hypothetical protein
VTHFAGYSTAAAFTGANHDAFNLRFMEWFEMFNENITLFVRLFSGSFMPAAQSI